jgi:hypothetical protein
VRAAKPIIARNRSAPGALSIGLRRRIVSPVVDRPGRRRNPSLPTPSTTAARPPARQHAGGALASGLATAEPHHRAGHDREMGGLRCGARRRRLTRACDPVAVGRRHG